jgi:hypothetical protein
LKRGKIGLNIETSHVFLKKKQTTFSKKTRFSKKNAFFKIGMKMRPKMAFLRPKTKKKKVGTSKNPKKTRKNTKIPAFTL